MADTTPTQVPPAPVSPWLVVMAVLGGLQALADGLALLDVLPHKVTAVAGLVIGVTTLTLTRIVYGTVTPWSSVAAKVTPSGQLVAGPAAPTVPLFPGSNTDRTPTVGEPVAVTPT